MRVALISPYDDRCYGMRIISSALRQRGHEVLLVIFKQFSNKKMTIEEAAQLRYPPPGHPSPVTETLEEGLFHLCYLNPITEIEFELLINNLNQFEPGLIGIGVTTPTRDACRNLTVRLKREFPKVPIIWGGVHSIIDPDDAIELANLICTGEGEYVMLELADDPERTDIVGTWRRVNGTMTRNPIRPLEQNLDRFPFADWGENEWLIDWNQPTALTARDHRPYFRGIFFTMTQRGCPFSCTYCFNHICREQHKGERYVRRRSVDNVIAECKMRSRQFNLPGLLFMDDVFLKDRQWLEEFAPRYAREVGLPFGGYAHPAVSDEEMIRLLVGAGLRWITLGIQSGSKYVAHDVYNRRHSLEAIADLARAGEKYGLDICYDMLSNCEYESEADCMESLKYLARLPRPRLIQVKGLGVFPPMRIASLDLPKHRLPETTFEFWNLLYLLTRYRQIAPERLLLLSQDDYLKGRPGNVRAFAVAFKQLDDATRANREQIESLKGRLNDASVRGMIRYARRMIGRWLPQPVADRIRAILARWRTARA